jgi:hypothetical protein
MQDFADTVMWPERRVTEEDLKRIREAEGADLPDSGDHGMGSQEPGAVESMRHYLRSRAVVSVALVAACVLVALSIAG